MPTPALGALGLVAMLVDAALMWKRGDAGAALWLVATSVLLAVAALALTKFGHFPINDEILQWDSANPPADWTRVQTRWSALHVGRTACAVTGFALLVVSNLLRP